MSALDYLFEPQPGDAAHKADADQAMRIAMADHRAAVMAWLQSPAAQRPQHWHAVAAAWRLCKQAGAAQEASRQASMLMRAAGKLRGYA